MDIHLLHDLVTWSYGARIPYSPPYAPQYRKAIDGGYITLNNDPKPKILLTPKGEAVIQAALKAAAEV